MLDMIMAYARAYASTITKREEGQGMVEYALILALCSVVAAATLTPLGGAIAALFTSITTQL